MSSKRRVLIVCTGNACRSQMAEALWRLAAGDRWECYSAGAHPAGFVHPLAVRAVEEVGGDLSQARSKHVSEFRDVPLDLVVTLCDDARAACPSYPHARRHLHWPFDDPYFATGGEAERWAAFCRVRDEIDAAIRDYLQHNEPAPAPSDA
ncbi:MAG: arsenate reductase ArsC [Pirellulales bacterium]|nr:arsenate reductase ArsC [Pirellulales bacterium]